MDFYMVVQINDKDGTFESSEEYFYTKAEAAAHYKYLTENHPDLSFAAFRCEEIKL